jgi:sarcosine oxidase subunit alpha
VLLVEEQARLGGSLAWQCGGNENARAVLDEWCRELAALDNVAIRCATMAGGHYADRWVALFDARRMTRVRAGAVVYATGAIEQPAVFGNNDLPGVLLGSACQQLVHWYAVRPCRRAVVLAANRDAYQVALDLTAAGSEVALIADLRPDGEPSPLGAEVAAARIPVHYASTVYEALPDPRTGSVQGALVARLGVAPAAGNGAPGWTVAPDSQIRVACDAIVMSAGWTPNAALPSQAGVRFRYDEQRAQLLPDAAPDGVFLAGRVRGVYELAAQREEGRDTGICAAEHVRSRRSRHTPTNPAAIPADAPRDRPEHNTRRAGHKHADPPFRPAADSARSHPYPIFEHPGHKNFVDLDEDLHLADLANAHQEGFDSVELLKRYSTVGMGPSQGKLANLNAARVLAHLNGHSMAHTGTTTARPFYQPVPLGHLAGLRHHPMRRTPLHDWHQQAGAVLVHAGDWYRPEYYPCTGSDRGACIVQEARQVRERLGMIDVSTLGKLLVNGPDAAELLERIYTGRFRKLAVGRCRYGVALDESGIVIEDGVIARLAADRFYVTATSSGVAAFYREMQRWATIWGLDVTLSDVTGHYAALNLAGPHSRAALQQLADLDLSAQAFPFLAAAEGTVCGVPALVLRVGFVGELGYEVHVPAWRGEHVWRTLFAAGADWQVRPFGLEAQRLLRLEKGHLIVGHDTDALTHPAEVGLEWAIGNNKPFFVGQRSLPIHAARPALRILAGVRWPDGYRGPLPEECNLIIHDGRIAGRITSIAPVSSLGFPLGMAFVEPLLAAPGTRIDVRLDDGTVSTAEVADLPFYDPAGDRQRQ